MTALKKAVRTRRGVEPTGRPARREVELGKESTNELVQDVRAESWSAALAAHARKHLRGRRPPRDSGRVDANLKVFSRLLIAGLDHINLR